MICGYCGELIRDLSGEEFAMRREHGIVWTYHRACYNEMLDAEAARETPEQAREGWEEDTREER